ncbi:hypothetical protein [Vibrio furnissii]|uniref:hypothetical protein n=1 Tax=Vibrio furnissii TaxID=29494 RepID=UPI001EEB8FED|nr:hypothetical protein [Vibrio furnissii]MCG6215578.1 hypothetical protein [Vibrio furnissii]
MSQVQVLQGEPLSESSVERLGFSFICPKPFPSPFQASPVRQHPHFISIHITENRAIKQSESFTSVSLTTTIQLSLNRDSRLQTFKPTSDTQQDANMPLQPASNAWIATQHPPRESSIIFTRDHTTMCTPHSPSHLSVIFPGIKHAFLPAFSHGIPLHHPVKPTALRF